MNFLGFSAEASSPAGAFLMDLVKPIRKSFATRCKGKNYCPDLQNIFIVFICLDQSFQGAYKERKYISRKNQYADIRLYLSYEDFLSATNAERVNMVWNTIQKAIEIVSQKVPSLKRDELLYDIKSCLF